MTIATKFAAVALSAATFATAATVGTTQAEARGGAFVAGLVGGAIIGGAIAAHSYPYYYRHHYYGPVYYGKPCHKVWVKKKNGYAYKTKVCH